MEEIKREDILEELEDIKEVPCKSWIEIVSKKIVSYFDKIEYQNEQLLETVESLKCCGNCKFSIAGTLNCTNETVVLHTGCFQKDGISESYWEQD